MHSEQQENIERVKTNIAPFVIAFVRSRADREFHLGELYKFVETQTGGACAPDSAGRIMRDLKQKHVIDYELVSRSQSLYRAKVREEQGVLF